MQRRIRASHVGALWALAVLLLAPARSGIESRLVCPRTVAVGEVVRVDLTLENRSCSATQVRVLTTLVGNANQRTDEVSILGPSIVERGLVLPAATDRFPGTCTNGFCDGFFRPCSSAADCACLDSIPTLSQVSIATPETLPESLDGTAAMLSIATEAAGGSAGDVSQCVIAVPEPTALVQLICAIGCVALSHRRRARPGVRTASEEVHP